MTLLFAAAEPGPTSLLDEHQILVFLVQLALLVGAARLLGGIANKLRQPPVVGQLLAGVLIGPSVLGQFYPDTFEWIFSDSTVGSAIYALAWLAVIMVLVVIGYETDLGIISRLRSAALNVSAGALLAPLVVVGLVALLTPSSFVGTAGRGLYAAFMALALSVAALPVVAKILQDMGMLRRNFGQVTLAVSMTMDSVGWLILAGLAGVAQEGFEPAQLLTSLGGLVLFVGLAATVGRWLLDQAMRLALRGGSNLRAALTVSLVAAIVGGAFTQALGLEAILGAFIVGIILATLRYQMVEVRHVLETITDSFFAPVFFAFSGLRVDIFLLGTPSAIVWTVVLIVLAVLAKLFGTLVGARRAGLGVREAWALGSGLSALGAMGIVVALVGLNLGVLSDTGYTVIVLAAIVTSLIAPVMLKWTVRGMEADEEERIRLESEAIRSQSQILGLRRILLPTRGGANSVYAASQISRLFKGAELTVLVVSGSSKGWWRRLVGKEVEQEAGPEAAMKALEGEECRLIRRRGRDPADAILREATLGYDLVVLGAPERTGGKGSFLNGDRPCSGQAGASHPDLSLSEPQTRRRTLRCRHTRSEKSAVVGGVEPGLPRRRGGSLLFGCSQRWDGLCLASDHRDRRWPLFLRHEEQRRKPHGRPGTGGGIGGIRTAARSQSPRRCPARRPAGGRAHHHRQLGKLGPVGGGRRQSAPHQPTLLRLRMAYILKHVTIPLVIVAVPDFAYRSTTR